MLHEIGEPGFFTCESDCPNLRLPRILEHATGREGIAGVEAGRRFRVDECNGGEAVSAHEIGSSGKIVVHGSEALAAGEPQQQVFGAGFNDRRRQADIEIVRRQREKIERSADEVIRGRRTAIAISPRAARPTAHHCGRETRSCARQTASPMVNKPFQLASRDPECYKP
jgi:hypothetical protein